MSGPPLRQAAYLFKWIECANSTELIGDLFCSGGLAVEKHFYDHAVIHQLRAGRRRIPKSWATFCYLFETSLPKQLSDKQTSSQVFHGKPSHDEGVSARYS